MSQNFNNFNTGFTSNDDEENTILDDSLALSEGRSVARRKAVTVKTIYEDITSSTELLQLVSLHSYSMGTNRLSPPTLPSSTLPPPIVPPAASSLPFGYDTNLYEIHIFIPGHKNYVAVLRSAFNILAGEQEITGYDTLFRPHLRNLIQKLCH